MEEDFIFTPEDASDHKKTFSTFDIQIPSASIDDIESHELYREGGGALPITFIWTKFKYREAKKAYEILRDNFQFEICDLLRHWEPKNENMYLLATHEMDPNFKPSRRWRWVSIVYTEKERIEFCWLHPYLRGRGCMTRFFCYYASNIQPLFFSPPATKPMQRCMAKVNMLAHDNQELCDKICEVSKKYLMENYFPTRNFSNYTSEQFLFFFSSLQVFFMDKTFMERPIEARRDIMGKVATIYDAIMRMPDWKEMLKKIPGREAAGREATADLERIVNYGK
jgi:hypothetical protein